mgnify:FL=1
MGVMPCNREGCDHILVYNDLRNRNGDRICDKCLEELEESLVASSVDLSNSASVWGFIESFMESPPGGSVAVDRRELVKLVLGRMVDRRP